MTAIPQPAIAQVLREAVVALAGTLQLPSNEVRIEASMLLCRALGDVNRAWLIAHEQDVLQPEQQAAFDALLQRRLAGEPLAYILGEREFYGLSFRVTPVVLIPRPETELLVELALERIPSPPAPLPQAGEGGRQAGTTSDLPACGLSRMARCSIRGLCVLDLGTGSGAVALSIAHARPDVSMTACDASPDALAVARENAQRLGTRNAEFEQSDWFSALDGRHFDLIVSNPPYVAQGDPHLQQGDLRFEPMSALASGADGLEDIRRIVAGAPAHLNPGGWLLLEHGYDQAARVRELLHEAGFCEVFSARDLAGIERTTGGRLTP